MKLFNILLILFFSTTLFSQGEWDWKHYQRNWGFYTSQAFAGGFTAIEKVTMSEVQYRQTKFPQKENYFGSYVGPRDKTWVNGYNWTIDSNGDYKVDTSDPRFLKFTLLYFTKDINHGAEFGRNIAWQVSVFTYKRPENNLQMLVDFLLASAIRGTAFHTTSYFLTDPQYR